MLTDLNPWVVSLHLLVSLAIISHGGAVPVADRPAGGDRHRSSPFLPLAWLTYAAAWAVLYLGTVVTGSGPHAGDLKAPRNGLDPQQLSQLHADLVFVFVGLTVGLLVALRASGGTPGQQRAVAVLLGVELAQGLIGFVQYVTDLPVALVELHLLGATLIISTVTWVLLEVREGAP